MDCLYPGLWIAGGEKGGANQIKGAAVKDGLEEISAYPLPDKHPQTSPQTFQGLFFFRITHPKWKPS